MMHKIDDLFLYEFDELINALRRDLRSQQSLGDCGTEWAQWHQSNARMVCRLLEVLNPKSLPLANDRHALDPIYSVTETDNTVESCTMTNQVEPACAVA